MNIIKGIDRIAVILAVIAILPSFRIASEFYEGRRIRVEIPARLPHEQTIQRGYKFPEWEDVIPKNYEYRHPPKWQCIIAGAAGSIAAFLIVLFGVRGTSRGIRFLSLWVIEGFKDENRLKK